MDRWSRETKGSNEERKMNQRSTFERSSRSEDCGTDDEKAEVFVIKISNFPSEVNEPDVKNSINFHCGKHLFVYPTSIRLVSDCKTGKPIFGYIKFNTQYEYNEVLRQGILVLSKKLRTEPIGPRTDKPNLNLDYIEMLQKEYPGIEFVN